MAYLNGHPENIEKLTALLEQSFQQNQSVITHSVIRLLYDRFVLTVLLETNLCGKAAQLMNSANLFLTRRAMFAGNRRQLARQAMERAILQVQVQGLRGTLETPATIVADAVDLSGIVEILDQKPNAA